MKQKNALLEEDYRDTSRHATILDDLTDMSQEQESSESEYEEEEEEEEE